MKHLNLRSCVLVLPVLFVCLSAGCQRSPEQPANSNSPAPANTTASDIKPTVKVEMRTDPVFVEAGKEVEISLIIKNDKDEVIKDLEKKPVRLIAVSEDLGEIYDLRPEVSSDGTFRVRQTFPHGGRYTLFLDLTLPDGSSNTQILGFGVAGDEQPKKKSKTSETTDNTIEGLHVKIKPESEPVAGKPIALDFSLTEGNSNKMPADIEDLEKSASFIIVSEDLKEFIHAGPLSVNDEDQAISTDVTFPKGGIYKIWAQFQRAGKSISVPLVVKVKAGEGEIDYSKIEIPKGAVRVTVNKDGFTPKTVEVKAGHPATLAFIRIDQENCGAEVSFPSLNIKKDLPLGKVVTIGIPANHPGEINFACGMDMLKGVVIVED